MRVFNLKNIKIIVLSLFTIAVNAQKGYEIELTVSGFSDTTVILGHYMGKSIYPDDTATLNSKGLGVFVGKKDLKEGMYVVYLPGGKYFEVIMGKDQHFSIETDTSDFVRNMKYTGSADNEIFIGFQNYMLEKRDEMIDLQGQMKKAKSEKDKTKVRDKIKALNKERIDKIHSIYKANPDLFGAAFLKATLEIEVPEELQSDRSKAYHYYRNHFFDNFDISDARLMNTPLYEDKINQYLDKVIPQHPDSIIVEVDKVIDKSKSDSALFRYVLVTLFNKYGKSKQMGMDAVQVHIADKYYLNESWWSDEKFLSDLEDRVKILTPLLIGKVAPDVELRYVPAEHFKDAANDTTLKRYPHAGAFMKISQVDAEFTVLLFWEANCSHCKKVVPAVYKMYHDTLKSMNVQVLAISTLFGEDGKEKWIDFVNKNELYDWINVWNPYDYQFKVQYDIRSTPKIYVLNRNKEIIGKNLGPENLLDLIKLYKQQIENEKSAAN